MGRIGGDEFIIFLKDIVSREVAEENALFYCGDIYSLKSDWIAFFAEQGICATLQCAILDNDAFSGFVGFDEYTGTRMWTKEEIGMLSLIFQLLTVFLQKKHAADYDAYLLTFFDIIKYKKM